MPTAFISSTSRDLADYRAAAIELCNQRQIVPVAMEFFEAMGVGATQGSKQALDQADLYIGIFAYRYGYIESGFDKSVTELEFDHAGSRNLDRLCFLVKPDYPWPPDAIDYEHHAALQAFKKRVETSLIRHEFTTIDDFKAKLILSLTRWQERQAGHAAVGSVPPTTPAAAPPPPSLFIGRDEDIAEIRRRLGLDSAGPVRRLTIIRGWPGVGKTTLVNALAYDAAIPSVYPDGLFWAALGDRPDIVSQLAAWKRRLGGAEGHRAATLAELIADVRALLRNRRALLIVDDVWQADEGAPFKQITGPGCSLLFTTRFGDVSRSLATVAAEDVYVLGVLSDAAGLDLLRRLAPTVVQRHADQAQRLVRDLEGLPLALRVAGRLLEAESALGINVESLMQEISDSHLLLDQVAPDDRFEAQTGVTPTISLLLERSTERLDDETRERFAMLGAFAPKPATFDLDAMKFVWDVDDPMSSVRRLVDRGLLEPIVSQGRFQMHAVLVKHAQALLAA